jgi:phospholipase C
MEERRMSWSRLPALLSAASILALGSSSPGIGDTHLRGSIDLSSTRTPIRNLVVIFDENVSFDHYFATYPYAANPPGEPGFHPRPGTPTVDNLANDITSIGPTGPLLTHNPNASNPVRLDRSDALTCDQDHGYTAEQRAAASGAQDLYPQNTGNGATLAQCLAGLSQNGTPEPIPAGAASNYAVMDFYDGNTVTALWNYAQHYAMSDNAYGTTYGPSTPGALNVTSANTYGVICGPSGATFGAPPCSPPTGYDPSNPAASRLQTGASRPAGPGTDFSDADPYFDICSYLPPPDGGDGRSPGQTIEMGGNTIGQELTAAGISWGWFEGGFDAGYVPGAGSPPTTATICNESHRNIGGASITDYIPHHDPFQYYAATANPMHLPPSSVAMIGKTDQANHQYDIADFWAAAQDGNLPAVSYLKAPAYEDGHAGYSDPLDEQTWLVTTINRLQRLPSWSSTAIVITWDDSDGWYDHVLGPLVTQSMTSLDALTGAGSCGINPAAVPRNAQGQPEQGRCGVGPRLPFFVISPYARPNFVDNTFIDQSSVVKFIEYNWRLPALGNGAADAAAGTILNMFDFGHPSDGRLFLDPATGEPVSGR